jgi:hypothetical protein
MEIPAGSYPWADWRTALGTVVGRHPRHKSAAGARPYGREVVFPPSTGRTERRTDYTVHQKLVPALLLFSCDRRLNAAFQRFHARLGGEGGVLWRGCAALYCQWPPSASSCIAAVRI